MTNKELDFTTIIELPLSYPEIISSATVGINGPSSEYKFEPYLEVNIHCMENISADQALEVIEPVLPGFIFHTKHHDLQPDRDVEVDVLENLVEKDEEGNKLDSTEICIFLHFTRE